MNTTFGKSRSPRLPYYDRYQVDERDQAIQALITERDELKGHCARLQGLLAPMAFPPGHYYSPLVDIGDPGTLRILRERLSAPLPAGVHIDVDAMRETLQRLARHHASFPFPRDQQETLRFYYGNPYFGCHDASVYFSMLLEYRPRRVVEIGSGFSTRLLLDTNERFFHNEMDITAIDPSPSQSVDPRSSPHTDFLKCRVQDAPLGLFDQLAANDILFVDSSHVSKTGSDVNFYVFEILPRLKAGVLVHIHDILYPFEYLAEWVVEDKRSWNEAYLIRAFLQYNTAFEILYWNNFVYHFLGSYLRTLMPLCLANEGGSLWLRRV
jgi:hypothetical protein